MTPGCFLRTNRIKVLVKPLNRLRTRFSRMNGWSVLAAVPGTIRAPQPRPAHGTLSDFFLPVLVQIAKENAAGVCKSLKQASRRLANSSIHFDRVMASALQLRGAVREGIEKEFPVRSQAVLLAAWEEFWLASLFELVGAYLSVADQVVHEKNLESSFLFHTSPTVSAELDLDALQEKIVLHASMLLRVKHAFLFLNRPLSRGSKGAQSLVLSACNHNAKILETPSFGPDTPLLGKAAQKLETILENHATGIKNLPACLAGMERLLAVPVLFSEELLGVLVTAEEEHGRLFDEEDRKLLWMYAAQIAIPLKNIFLYQAQIKAAEELEEKNKALEFQSELILRKSAHLVVLNDVAQKANQSLELQEVLTLLARSASESIGVDRSILWISDEKAGGWQAVSGYGISSTALKEFFIKNSEVKDPRLKEFLYGRAPLKMGSEAEAQWFVDYFSGKISLKAAVLVPVTLKGKNIGFVLVDDTRETHEFLDDEIALIISMVNQTAIAIENAQLYQKVKEQAITDGLTGLYNHRFFQLRLADEFAHCKRYGTQLSMIILDVDHFKMYNDTYGHMAGDLALKEIANLTRLSVRENDIVARYGGEEFVIILPRTSADGALAVAERIRKTVSGCRFLGNLHIPEVSITVSLGIAEYTKELSSREELVRKADEALYAAKKAGRNRTLISSSALQSFPGE